MVGLENQITFPFLSHISDWIQDILYPMHGYFILTKQKILVRVSEGLPPANKRYSYNIPFMDEKQPLYLLCK